MYQAEIRLLRDRNGQENSEHNTFEAQHMKNVWLEELE